MGCLVRVLRVWRLKEISVGLGQLCCLYPVYFFLAIDSFLNPPTLNACAGAVAGCEYGLKLGCMAPQGGVYQVCLDRSLGMPSLFLCDEQLASFD